MTRILTHSLLIIGLAACAGAKTQRGPVIKKGDKDTVDKQGSNDSSTQPDKTTDAPPKPDK